jgi:hypothetical protein
MLFFFFIFVGFGCMGIEAWAEGAPIEALDGAALAGTAMVRAVPPMAASPTTKAAAVLAMRGFDHVSSLSRSLVGRSRQGSSPPVIKTSTLFWTARRRKHRLNTVWPG